MTKTRWSSTLLARHAFTGISSETQSHPLQMTGSHRVQGLSHFNTKCDLLHMQLDHSLRLIETAEGAMGVFAQNESRSGC